MTPQEMIDVIAAYRDGKQIEAQPAGIFGDGVPWKLCGQPTFNFPEYNYRVKPPALRPHWPAVLNVRSVGMTVSDMLFPDVDSAKTQYCTSSGLTVIRLATEYPPVMLP